MAARSARRRVLRAPASPRSDGAHSSLRWHRRSAAPPARRGAPRVPVRRRRRRSASASAVAGCAARPRPHPCARGYPGPAYRRSPAVSACRCPRDRQPGGRSAWRRDPRRLHPARFAPRRAALPAVIPCGRARKKLRRACPLGSSPRCRRSRRSADTARTRPGPEHRHRKFPPPPLRRSSCCRARSRRAGPKARHGGSH